jgi:plastocyanin/FtsP/CotA-like multicopper oxidase with cupredoxin domain
MPTIDYWIQIENHAWDTVPWERYGPGVFGTDRMTGKQFPRGASPATLISPETLVTRNVYMHLPLTEDALILRRYTANWAKPDDRKVNPWDLNEPDPTDNGTMGTIPGPVIECNAGTRDTVVVHFRNKDFRKNKSVKARAHSLHPHGFVFKPTSDGAYPLTPPDPAPINAVGPEAALWAQVGVTGPNKQGDRVPPGGTFTYTWETLGWPSTAGVWLYHDHSICDMENVEAGAIGIIVIHNVPADTNNDFLITPADLPNGTFTDSPVSITCFPFDFEVERVGILPHDLSGLGLTEGLSPGMGGMPGMSGMPGAAPRAKAVKSSRGGGNPKPGANVGPPVLERLIQRGDLLLEANADFSIFRRYCIRNYRNPPSQALYLLLFHSLDKGPPGQMYINGRTFLGNTPTLIAGTSTKMRFGVVGMGSDFHTFHIHGHRWIIPGPHGNNPGAIQGSPLDTPVSQFEDTRTFGPANSFVFTLDEKLGSFMRAGGNLSSDDAKGEWHMHCHVLGHMMMGMMGSLLVIGGGEIAGNLPKGEECPADIQGGGGGLVPVSIKSITFDPPSIMINKGDKVRWTNTVAVPHTVSSNKSAGQAFTCAPVSAEVFDSGATPMNLNDTFEHVFNTAGTFAYHCEVHGCTMPGNVTVM